MKIHLKAQVVFTQVTVVVTKRSSDGIPAPTISIRAINPATSDSLRKEGMSWKQAQLNKTCGGTETSVEDCIKEITFTQEDVLHDVIFGWMKRNIKITQIFL